MGDRLKQPVVVDNRPGAGTELGAAAVARAAADGYMLLISSNSTFTINPALKSKLQYSPDKSFEAIGLIGSSPLVLLAQPTFQASNVRELIGLAKAKPGKLTYASFGAGTTSHLAGEMLKSAAGINLLHVPYKGSAPAMTDLLGGQVDLSFDTTVASLPMLRTGKAKALATTGSKRSAQLPDVPTVAEAGFPQYEMSPWLAVVAPRGLPEAVRTRLSVALAETLADTAIRKQIEDTGIEVSYQAPAAYDARVARELPLLRAFVARAGITLE
jgi:tripartite-type tricarboxylate transporter receptor subunit TctC